MQHLAALLDAACARQPERVALIGDAGPVRYRELDRAAAVIAGELRGAGITRDEPVAVRVSNRAGDFAALLGAWRAGAVVVPVHRLALPASVAEVLERTGARFILDGDGGSVISLSRSAPPERELLGDAALIIFTSGTTGRPKGVVLGHATFAGKLAAIDSPLRFDEETRTLLILQLGFSFGQWVSLLTLARGGTLVLHERFDATRVLRTLAQERITRFGVIPTMLRALLPLLRTATEALPLQENELLAMAGGEPLAYPLGRALRDLMPRLRLWDIYGLTETSTSDFMLAPEEQDRFPGTIGRPTPGVEFTLLDERGRAAAPGEAGELALRTPFIMQGYLDAPEQTAAAFQGGWFRTGDLAETPSPGIVRLVGRSKELILRGGNKISPIEVERAYLEHPGIAEALCTGLPDEKLGEAIHLLVVPLPGASLDPAALRRWARDRLERYKLPDRIHLGSAIPTGRTGKADRAALKALLTAGKP
ncbi:MAG TPA: AMP-binding protein [Stellaceae bacterium]|nr:AMP-binding protein [Stellaceae bacterium]